MKEFKNIFQKCLITLLVLTALLAINSALPIEEELNKTEETPTEEPTTIKSEDSGAKINLN